MGQAFEVCHKRTLSQTEEVNNMKTEQNTQGTVSKKKQICQFHFFICGFGSIDFVTSKEKHSEKCVDYVNQRIWYEKKIEIMLNFLRQR